MWYQEGGSKRYTIGIVILPWRVCWQQTDGTFQKSMVDNFAFLIDSIGFIPNGTRDYFETRSQPPFFLGDGESRFVQKK